MVTLQQPAQLPPRCDEIFERRFGRPLMDIEYARGTLARCAAAYRTMVHYAIGYIHGGICRREDLAYCDAMHGTAAGRPAMTTEGEDSSAAASPLSTRRTTTISVRISRRCRTAGRCVAGELPADGALGRLHACFCVGLLDIIAFANNTPPSACRKIEVR